MIPARHIAASDDARENGPRGKPNQRAGGSKRPVLGNVSNQVRRQPQRVAKERHSIVHNGGPSKVDQENQVPSKLCNGKKANAGFAIYEDAQENVRQVSKQSNVLVHEDEPMVDQENVPEHQLFDHVLGLNVEEKLVHGHIPLAPLQLSNRLSGSPMVIDVHKEEAVIGSLDQFGLDPYFEDIYSYLRLKEFQGRPARNYMNRQSDVTTVMRNILVDWLVEVGEEYKLHRETLFLAVSYIDRFLSMVGVQRPKLQLVGTSCMFIAAKYEEIYPPDVSEFVYITDDTYTRNQVIKMESVILKLLEFKVAVPTVNWFCERFLEALQPTERCKNLVFFLSELTLIETEQYMDFAPSMIAASAIVLARSTVGEGNPWPMNISQISRYTLCDLEPCVHVLYEHYTRKSSLPQQAVVEKYKQDKFGRVSMIDPPPVLALY